MDTISPRQRSHIMSRIKSKNTSPELQVRSFLHRHGFRFRLHVKKLPGTPDIVLRKYNAIVEVRGCFWHQHPGCSVARIPKSNVSFWEEKFRRNVRRDTENLRKLEELGYKVFILWDCGISHNKLFDLCQDLHHLLTTK